MTKENTAQEMTDKFHLADRYLRRIKTDAVDDALMLAILTDLIDEASSLSEQKWSDTESRLEAGRNYLMSTEQKNLTTEDCLAAFGFQRNGL